MIRASAETAVRHLARAHDYSVPLQRAGALKGRMYQVSVGDSSARCTENVPCDIFSGRLQEGAPVSEALEILLVADWGGKNRTWWESGGDFNGIREHWLRRGAAQPQRRPPRQFYLYRFSANARRVGVSR